MMTKRIIDGLLSQIVHQINKQISESMQNYGKQFPQIKIAINNKFGKKCHQMNE